jgi:isoprenylcysteine carboxyl methyltransferase (ICMT) family protein YpbQ
MVEYTVKTIFWLITVLLGAWFISCAVKEFKEDKYFPFGVCIMLAINMAYQMIETIIN